MLFCVTGYMKKEFWLRVGGLRRLQFSYFISLQDRVCLGSEGLLEMWKTLESFLWHLQGYGRILVTKYLNLQKAYLHDQIFHPTKILPNW